ncbi:hypothetical protein JYT28_01285 [Desulfobulbus sp. AH-315-M07]|nr:hypothetical protein [Desulfobulbus sp. AH-315-M07]
MAICTDCNLEMRTAEGCTVTSITLDGTVFNRIVHGSGKAWGPAKGRCSECGAEPGKIHHAGCQYEECPKCGEAQMLACGCEKTG